MQDKRQSQKSQVPSDGYPYPPEIYEDEIDLVQLCKAIWAGKWIITGVTMVFAVVAIVISLLLPNIYRSEVLLAPASGDEKGMLSGMAGQFGGLASLAGIDLGGGGADKTTLALEVLKSRVFITNFIREHELSVPLMAAKGWDQKAGQWEIDENTYNSAQGHWVRDASPPRKQRPSDLEMYETFRKNVLIVSEDTKTGFIRVGLELMSPVFAQKWLTLLIKDLNDYMRKKDIEDAEESIAYLKTQLSKTSVAEMQTIFYQLIEQQTKKMMLAEVRDEYVLRVVDPAVVPEKKIKPKRFLMAGVGMILGVVIGVGVVLVRHSLSNDDLT